MKVDIFELFQAEMTSLGMNFVLFSDPCENLERIDYGFRGQLFQDFSYAYIGKNLKERAVPGTVQLMIDEMGCNYLCVAFSPVLCEEYGYHYLIIGPFLTTLPTAAMVRQYLSKLDIPPASYQGVQEFYNRVPVIPSLDLCQAIFRPLLLALLGDDCNISGYSLHFSFLPEADHYEFQAATDPAFSLIEERYQAESTLLDAVSKGQTDNALLAYRHFMQFRLMPRTADPIRNRKNILFSLNTQLRKAAQSSQVHPYHIDNLSTQFAIQIENCTSHNQLDTLSHTMVRKYCMLVSNYSRREYSALVQFSMNYIETHYNQELSLDILAKLSAVSNSYLSALFKKETGQTVTDFINTTRIRRSLTLLNTSRLSVQDIAARCGFPDANYFARIFKRYQKLSPKDYRKQVMG